MNGRDNGQLHAEAVVAQRTYIPPSYLLMVKSATRSMQNRNV